MLYVSCAKGEGGIGEAGREGNTFRSLAALIWERKAQRSVIEAKRVRAPRLRPSRPMHHQHACAGANASSAFETLPTYSRARDRRLTEAIQGRGRQDDLVSILCALLVDERQGERAVRRLEGPPAHGRPVEAEHACQVSSAPVWCGVLASLRGERGLFCKSSLDWTSL